jgi:hypothetical protein
MKIRARGRAALIFATGLLVCFAAPPLATAGTDDSKSVKHHRHYMHQRSGKVAAKSSDTRSDSQKEPATDTAENGGINAATLSPSIANANALLAAADNTLAESAKAMTARANNIMQAAADAQSTTDSRVVAPDQLNEVDRALSDEKPPARTTLLMASAEPPAAPEPRVTTSSESSTWDQTSLIGKIFIGFGALLTLASAARMFMA